MLKRIIIKAVKYIFSLLGYNIHFTPVEKYKVSDDKVRINVGAGDWECCGWKNLDYPSEWYSDVQSKHNFIPYDIRNDNLPFNDETVDLIYSSHVVEHIENEHIQKLFNECYRVLKFGGGVRICCPDAEFLWDATKCNKDYWEWRDNSFKRADLYDLSMTPRDVDKLVSEIAQAQCINSIDTINNDLDYEEKFNQLDRDSFYGLLTGDLKFNPAKPGYHINWWTFDKMKNMLNKAGFKTVIRSKYSGSVFHDMKDTSKFDVVWPLMSLYVEAIK